MEKENDKDDKKSDKKDDKNSKDEKEDKKALFIQRLIAFLFDVIIVSLVASLVATPFVDVEKSDKLSNKTMELTEKYGNGELEINDFSVEYMDISYKLARNNGILSLITIVFEILYFVVFQIYNNGQTLGKKLMKIKVVAQNGDLSMNQMIFRALVANSILVEIVSFAFMTFCSKDVYFYSVGMFGVIQFVISLISVFMVMYGKNGCAIHDKLAHTKVIKI